jgi:hypothetical protein
MAAADSIALDDVTSARPRVAVGRQVAGRSALAPLRGTKQAPGLGRPSVVRLRARPALGGYRADNAPGKTVSRAACKGAMGATHARVHAAGWR